MSARKTSAIPVYFATLENRHGEMAYTPVFGTKELLYQDMSRELSSEEGNGYNILSTDVEEVERLEIRCYEVVKSWEVKASPANVKIIEV